MRRKPLLSAYHPTVKTVGFPGLHFVKILKAKRLPYISLNGDLAKLRIERKIVPLSLFLKLNKKMQKKKPQPERSGLQYY